jgi:hypothetical protein
MKTITIQIDDTDYDALVNHLTKSLIGNRTVAVRGLPKLRGQLPEGRHRDPRGGVWRDPRGAPHQRPPAELAMTYIFRIEVEIEVADREQAVIAANEYLTHLLTTGAEVDLRAPERITVQVEDGPCS